MPSYANGMEAFPVEVEVNWGWGDAVIAIACLPIWQ